MRGWEPQDLLARGRALRQDATPLQAVVDSIPHLERLAKDAKNAASVQALKRLDMHVELVLECLEQTTAIADAGLAHEWTTGLQSMTPVPLRSRPDLPIFTLSTTDTLQIKAFTLVALDRVRDYLDLAELSRGPGTQAAASAIAVLDDVFSSRHDDGAPLATQLLRRLAQPRIRPASSESTAPPTEKQWADMTDKASELCCHVLLSKEPRGAARPEVETSSFEEMVVAIRDGDLLEWQQLATVVRRKPWGTFARSLEKAARSAGDEAVMSALSGVVHFSRARRDQREREEVARRISRSVQSTGLTQKAFAARIGTSASRLSTYVTGSVTPSASMMLRIESQKAEIDQERKSGLL